MVFSSWLRIPTGLVSNSVQDGAMTIGKPDNLLDEASFWHFGGRSPEAVSDTFYLEALEEEPLPYPGPKLINASYGHCAINTRLHLESLNDSITSQVLLIGGNPHGQSVKTYCKQQNSINNALCKGGGADEFAWRDFKDLKEERIGHICTAFEHETEGLTILVTNGNSSNSTEIFLVEKCSTCESNCEKICDWSYELNDKPFTWMGGPPVTDSAMQTLNGIPTIFGGLQFDGIEEASESYRLYHLREVDDEFEWYPNSYTLKDARQRHSVVAVPLSFLCAEEETTSTER